MSRTIKKWSNGSMKSRTTGFIGGSCSVTVPLVNMDVPLHSFPLPTKRRSVMQTSYVLQLLPSAQCVLGNNCNCVLFWLWIDPTGQTRSEERKQFKLQSVSRSDSQVLKLTDSEGKIDTDSLKVSPELVMH